MRDSSRVAGTPAAARACTIVCTRTGWAVTRHVTLTAAHVDVGSVATRGGQRGGGASGRSLPAERCQRRGEAICRRRHGAGLWRAGGYPPHYRTCRRTQRGRSPDQGDLRRARPRAATAHAGRKPATRNAQRAMREAHVSFAAQNRVLAKLAPMERDVTER